MASAGGVQPQNHSPAYGANFGERPRLKGCPELRGVRGSRAGSGRGRRCHGTTRGRAEDAAPTPAVIAPATRPGPTRGCTANAVNWDRRGAAGPRGSRPPVPCAGR